MRVRKKLERAARVHGHPASQERKKGRWKGIVSLESWPKPATLTYKLQESHTHSGQLLMPPPCSLLGLPAWATIMAMSQASFRHDLFTVQVT